MRFLVGLVLSLISMACVFQVIPETANAQYYRTRPYYRNRGTHYRPYYRTRPLYRNRGPHTNPYRHRYRNPHGYGAFGEHNRPYNRNNPYLRRNHRFFR